MKVIFRPCLILLMALVLSAIDGCKGSIEAPDGQSGIDAVDGAEDAGEDDASDSGQADGDQGGFDAGEDAGADQGVDAGSDGGDECVPDCAGKQCGDDGCGGDCGTCTDDEVCVDSQCQEPGACDSVVCDDKEWCKEGICRCQSGWVREGDECQPEIPTAFAERTPENVCAKWNADYPKRAEWVWEEGPDNCDNGTLNPESIDDGIRRINLFRWLVGLYPVFNQRSLNVYAQPCAVMIKENGDLNHEPPTDWECYSSEGASGAGHSNECMGRRDPAGAVDAYIGDNNVTSLGHRRWLLDPPYLPAGIGHTTSWNCTYVMTGGNPYSPDWLAYPPPGPCPRAAILGKWSLGAWGFDSENTTVTVEDLNTGDQQQPSFYFPGGWYGSYSYLAFDPGSVQAGHGYEVTVTEVRTGSGQEPQTVTYTVQVVDCTGY